MTILSAIAGSYILGSIPWGYVLCRIFKKIDIRKYGSGNIGATNVYRAAGGPLAITVLILDVLKGYLPVLLTAKHLSIQPLILIAAGMASILGHNFSVFLRGKGGKGVSTSFGVILGLFPLPALIALIIWISVIFITRYVSAGALLAAFSLPVFVYIFQRDAIFTLTGIVIFIMIVYTHRTNIKRLSAGQENKVRLPWHGKTQKP